MHEWERKWLRRRLGANGRERARVGEQGGARERERKPKEEEQGERGRRAGLRGEGEGGSYHEAEALSCASCLRWFCYGCSCVSAATIPVPARPPPAFAPLARARALSLPPPGAFPRLLRMRIPPHPRTPSPPSPPLPPLPGLPGLPGLRLTQRRAVAREGWRGR